MRVKQELEDLIQGKSIEKPIHEDITYEDIEPDRPKEMLWSFLFFTGYLKKTGERLEDGVRYISMSIPNQEVRYIYKNTVLSWFEQKMKKGPAAFLFQSGLWPDTGAGGRNFQTAERGHQLL